MMSCFIAVIMCSRFRHVYTCIKRIPDVGVALRIAVCNEKFRCYEAKIEESEKAGSRRESNPGHLACSQCSATELRQPDNPPASTILYMYCTGGTEMPQIVRASGCLVVVAQWQSTGCTSQVSWD